MNRPASRPIGGYFTLCGGTLLAMAVLCLTACSSPIGERALAEYLTRLARSLDLVAEPPASARPPDLPARADLRLPLRAGELGTLEFLALTGCRVQITIGKRNSSLGRVASASQRLLLTLEYLRLAPECSEHLRGMDRDELAAKLDRAWRLHRSQLPALIFNATLGGPEFRRFWRAPRQLGAYPAETSSAVVTALEGLGRDVQRWLAGDYRADGSRFEAQLDAVRRGDGGALLRALALQRAWLEAANELFVRYAARRGALCKPLLRPTAATVVPTVVRKFFIGGIQPWSAALHRRQLTLLPPVRALEMQLLPVAPASYRRWRELRQQGLALAEGAPRTHVRALQRFLEPCGGTGLTPASSN